MVTYNLCILGFGNVGRALVRHLQEKTTELRTRYDIEWRLTGVATRRMGWIADPGGLDVEALLNGQVRRQEVAAPDNVQDWLAEAQADVLFELTSTDPQTGQPAIDHLRAALERGAHAITANKGALIHAYPELHALAAAQGKQFLFEATVMGGAPVFSLFRYSLPAARLVRFRGLLNSTSNVIIEEMERGKSFEEAVKKAQDLGIAETDPSVDVDGWDAALKICAMAAVLMQTPLTLAQVEREGIQELHPEMVQQARAAGKPFKLVAHLERAEDGLIASVRPEQLTLDDPLSAVNGGSMLAHFEMDMIPGLTMTLHVPETGTVGPEVTAYDVMADFIRAVSAE